MTEPIIVDAIRTARGKRKGALSALHPVDLMARTLAGALDRANVKPQDVDDVIMGCVTQVGEQGMNIARGAVLAAGLPVEIPGATVNRFCGSGLQAVNFGAQAIASGAAQLVIAAERCAELFGLRVLDRRIQDLKFNFTTFVAAGPTKG